MFRELLLLVILSVHAVRGGAANEGRRDSVSVLQKSVKTQASKDSFASSMQGFLTALLADAPSMVPRSAVEPLAETASSAVTRLLAAVDPSMQVANRIKEQVTIKDVKSFHLVPLVATVLKEMPKALSSLDTKELPALLAGFAEDYDKLTANYVRTQDPQDVVFRLAFHFISVFSDQLGLNKQHKCFVHMADQAVKQGGLKDMAVAINAATMAQRDCTSSIPAVFNDLLNHWNKTLGAGIVNLNRQDTGAEGLLASFVRIKGQATFSAGMQELMLEMDRLTKVEHYSLHTPLAAVHTFLRSGRGHITELANATGLGRGAVIGLISVAFRDIKQAEVGELQGLAGSWLASQAKKYDYPTAHSFLQHMIRMSAKMEDADKEERGQLSRVAVDELSNSVASWIKKTFQDENLPESMQQAIITKVRQAMHIISAVHFRHDIDHSILNQQMPTRVIQDLHELMKNRPALSALFTDVVQHGLDLKDTGRIASLTVLAAQAMREDPFLNQHKSMVSLIELGAEVLRGEHLEAGEKIVNLFADIMQDLTAFASREVGTTILGNEIMGGLKGILNQQFDGKQAASSIPATAVSLQRKTSLTMAPTLLGSKKILNRMKSLTMSVIWVILMAQAMTAFCFGWIIDPAVTITNLLPNFLASMVTEQGKDTLQREEYFWNEKYGFSANNLMSKWYLFVWDDMWNVEGTLEEKFDFYFEHKFSCQTDTGIAFVQFGLFALGIKNAFITFDSDWKEEYYENDGDKQLMRTQTKISLTALFVAKLLETTGNTVLTKRSCTEQDWLGQGEEEDSVEIINTFSSMRFLSSIAFMVYGGFGVNVFPKTHMPTAGFYADLVPLISFSFLTVAQTRAIYQLHWLDKKARIDDYSFYGVGLGPSFMRTMQFVDNVASLAEPAFYLPYTSQKKDNFSEMFATLPSATGTIHSLSYKQSNMWAQIMNIVSGASTFSVNLFALAKHIPALCDGVTEQTYYSDCPRAFNKKLYNDGDWGMMKEPDFGDHCKEDDLKKALTLNELAMTDEFVDYKKNGGDGPDLRCVMRNPGIKQPLICKHNLLHKWMNPFTMLKLETQWNEVTQNYMVGQVISWTDKLRTVEALHGKTCKDVEQTMNGLATVETAMADTGMLAGKTGCVWSRVTTLSKYWKDAKCNYQAKVPHFQNGFFYDDQARETYHVTVLKGSNEEIAHKEIRARHEAAKEQARILVPDASSMPEGLKVEIKAIASRYITGTGIEDRAAEALQAEAIKKDLDAKHNNGLWHVAVGRDFSAYVTPSAKPDWFFFDMLLNKAGGKADRVHVLAYKTPL